jgi:transposase
MEKNENIFVGIDVAKDTLVLHILPTNQRLTVTNDPKGIKELISLFKGNAPKPIVLEATRGLERELLSSESLQGARTVEKSQERERSREEERVYDPPST